MQRREAKRRRGAGYQVPERPNGVGKNEKAENSQIQKKQIEIPQSHQRRKDMDVRSPKEDEAICCHGFFPAKGKQRRQRGEEGGRIDGRVNVKGKSLRGVRHRDKGQKVAEKFKGNFTTV